LPEGTPHPVLAFYISIAELSYAMRLEVDAYGIGIIGSHIYTPDNEDWASESENVWCPVVLDSVECIRRQMERRAGQDIRLGPTGWIELSG
jgi:hypothetical protein